MGAKAFMSGLAGVALVAGTLAVDVALGGAAGPGLMLATGLAAAPLALPLGLLGALAGPWPMRAIAGLVAAAGWYWAGDRLGARLPGAEGALAGEAFGAVIWKGAPTAALMTASVAGYLWVIALVSRVRAAPRN